MCTTAQGGGTRFPSPIHLSTQRGESFPSLKLFSSRRRDGFPGPKLCSTGALPCAPQHRAKRLAAPPMCSTAQGGGTVFPSRLHHGTGRRDWVPLPCAP